MPFFNRQNNDDLILAIQAAGVSRGRNGFRKDKGGEKLAESEEDLLEHRTDGTDAFDTLYIGCEKFPYRDAFSINVSGVIWYHFLLGDATPSPGYRERSQGLRHSASIPIARQKNCRFSCLIN